MTVQFSGSMVAIVTPMNTEGAIDYVSFEGLIDWHLASGTQGLVVLGTTGESATVTDEEREKLLALAVQRVAGKIPVIAGVGTNNTQTTIALARHAEKLDVDALLVVTPYYNKPPQAGLLAHYQAIHESTQKPIILYNVPGRTACDIAVETVAELASFERIIGLKDANTDLSRVSAIRERVNKPFALLSGDDATALEYVQKGGDGVISVTANVMPKAMADVMALAVNDPIAAQKLDDTLQILHKNLFIEANPIPVKWALARMGKIPGGLRLPLVSLAKQNETLLEDVLKKVGIIE